MRFRFEHSFARELPGLSLPHTPDRWPAPRLLHWNADLAEALWGPRRASDDETPEALAAWFSGHTPLPGTQPVAQAYAGHQFGGFSPRLGDGRAVLLGEVPGAGGQRHDLALKGSGRTAFSRGGDGKAAVGPMLRELLIGEALHALGVPSTRALAVVATGETVQREHGLPGAVLARVAASHLRVGSFQYLAARGERDGLQRLLDYAVARHDPDLRGRSDAPWAFLHAVAQRQARLVAQWLNLGFIHGVMNTDNMTVSGESIDFGPCAFLEAYDPAAVFSSIDRQGRYAFGNQGPVAAWNLARLAESLLPLLLPDDAPEAAVQAVVAEATAVLDRFAPALDAHWRAGQAAKLGLADPDPALADDWLALLHTGGADFTLAWRRLAEAREGDAGPLRALFGGGADTGTHERLDAWLARWRTACTATAAQLRAVNPLVIPRNHRVEAALAAASEHGDMAPCEALLAAVRAPYDVPANAQDAEPAPPAVTACYRTFCGT